MSRGPCDKNHFPKFRLVHCAIMVYLRLKNSNFWKILPYFSEWKTGTKNEILKFSAQEIFRKFWKEIPIVFQNFRKISWAEDFKISFFGPVFHSEKYGKIFRKFEFLSLR